MILTCFTTLLFYSSCTYDYFEDETNYILYVPEVKDGNVTNCSILVYGESGQLVGNKSMNKRDVKDPRMKEGLFAFRLFPGNYSVYCYTNTDSVLFSDINNISESAFSLKKNKLAVDHYVQPSKILFDKKWPSIVHTGVLKKDTAQIGHYTGRVTIRFKNFPLNVSDVDAVELEGTNIGTVQYLKTDTLTTSVTDADKMLHRDPIPEQFNSEYMELDYRFFPSIVDKGMLMNFKFIGENDNVLMSFPVNLIDAEGTPLRLLHGQRIIIEIDTYTVVKISLIGWDEDIVSGDTNME